MLKLRRLPALTLCLGLGLAFTGAGCGLFKPGSASFASVKIKDHSPEEIIQAATQVFREDGYHGGQTRGYQMVFEKEGSRANTFAYEGVVGTYYGAQTVMRVRAEVVDMGSGTQRLQCQAYVVKDYGQGNFEEEQRLTNVRGGPYQSLLNKAAKKLKEQGQ
jgi:hypothetical protein